MNIGMKIGMVAIALLSFAGVASAEMVFQKVDDESVVLTLKDDKSATIQKSEKVLIEGKMEEQDSSLVIVREEGDVCPSVSVELFHDIVLGENMSAEVLTKVDEEGTAALEYCLDTKLIDGTYSRKND